MERNNANQIDLRNNAHLGPNLPSNHLTAMGNNKNFDTPNGLKFFMNIFIGNILSFYPSH